MTGGNRKNATTGDVCSTRVNRALQNNNPNNNSSPPNSTTICSCLFLLAADRLPFANGEPSLLQFLKRLR